MLDVEIIEDFDADGYFVKVNGKWLMDPHMPAEREHFRAMHLAVTAGADEAQRQKLTQPTGLKP